MGPWGFVDHVSTHGEQDRQVHPIGDVEPGTGPRIGRHWGARPGSDGIGRRMARPSVVTAHSERELLTASTSRGCGRPEDERVVEKRPGSAADRQEITAESCRVPGNPTVMVQIGSAGGQESA